MANSTDLIYGGFLLSLANKQIDLSEDTLNVMLLGSGYTFSESHRYVSDLGENEISGTGYTPGGLALSGVTCTLSNNVLSLSAINPQWPDSTIAAYNAVIVDTTPGTATTNPLICCIELGQQVSDTNGTFALNFPNGVILTLTAEIPS